MIACEQKLGAAFMQIREAPWVAVDTEADSLHAYPEKLCLVQVSIPEADLILDPLGELDLGQVIELLRDKEIILHGADYDLRLLHRTYGFVPGRLFDTMWGARLLGVTAFGLGDLVEKFLGIRLEKGSQKANWARRPLTPVMMEYARNDTRHLRALSERLRAALVEKGRLGWLEECCARVIQDSVRVAPEDPDNEWRIKGADRLDRRGLAVVRELYYWRETAACQANRPPFFVLAHDRVIELAASAASGRPVDPLLPRRFAPHRRAGALDAIQRAMELADGECPIHRRATRRRLSEAQVRRMEEFKRRRDRHAAALGIDPTLIASKSTLFDLGLDWETASSRLMNWQRQLLED